MSHVAAAIVPIATAKAHTVAETSYIVAATAHMNRFEPTTTAHEKW